MMNDFSDFIKENLEEISQKSKLIELLRTIFRRNVKVIDIFDVYFD
jgi:hypothetical protein